MKDDFRAPHSHIRSSWNAARILARGPLTDRAIEKYRAAGWYSPELKQARRDLNEKRRLKQAVRSGNFISDNGRLIYSPK